MIRLFQILTFAFILLIISACNTEEPQLDKQKAEELLNQENLLKCYNELRNQQPEGFDGTGCEFCIYDELRPLDTITVYSAYTSEFVEKLEDRYDIKWSVHGFGGTILGPDTLKYVKVILNSVAGSDSLTLIPQIKSAKGSCQERISLSY